MKKERMEFLIYFFKCMYRKAIWKVLKKKLNVKFDRPLISLEVANEDLYKMILKEEPFVVSRFGCVEISIIGEVIKNKFKFGKINENDKRTLITNAGFFPNEDEQIKRFANLYLKLIPNIDYLGVWNSCFEDYLVKNFMGNTKISQLKFIEPYNFQTPWSYALQNKKVLVIHPFANTIKSQYQKREFLFKNKKILPKFELITLTAIQTIAGNKSEFKTWFEALDFMHDKALEIDFDVAIIGCGAYGLPLAIKLKLAGKKAIHLGGATQMLFGIKGKRWDNNPILSKLYNQHWVRPNFKETPKGKEKIEDSCYW